MGLAVAIGVPAGPAHASAVANIPYAGGAVMTGHERVFLVFWGTQWGSVSHSTANGDTLLSNDTLGVAPTLQEFFKGLGTGGESWSSVMTQYCQGVPVGTQICPPGAAHVAYPTNGALAGVWVDNTGAAPANASLAQIGNEASAAAALFGNTTAASNANSVYVVVSPHGTNPDNFINSGFAAEHYWTSSPNGELAYINLPYVPDKPDPTAIPWASPTGPVGYFTAMASHEYAEAITDPFGSGWIASDGTENGDLCNTFSAAHFYNFGLQLTTGLFWVQATWSNTFTGGSWGSGTGDCVGETSGSGIVNGTFTNSYNDWASNGGSNAIVTDPQTNASGLLLGSPTVAGTVVPTGGDARVEQHFTVPAGDNWLSFRFKQNCTWNQGEVRVTLEDADNFFKGSQDLLPLSASTFDGPCVSNGGWMLATAPVIPGHLYSLQFNNQNWISNADNTVFEDVQLSTRQPIPAAPGGIQLVNECNFGWIIYWNPVPGAATYNVYANGTLIAGGLTSGYYGYGYPFTTPLNEDYVVTAVSATGVESQPSIDISNAFFDQTAC